MEIQIGQGAESWYRQEARQAGVRPEQLCAMVLENFVANRGKIFVGSWQKGRRIVVDWPRLYYTNRVEEKDLVKEG